jgi:O-antigen/teichoic acid export membrane protein
MFRIIWKALSANGLQLLLNQAMSLCLFLLLARHLNKQVFGVLNGILGGLLLAFGILSFGIDQLLVRKMAAGEEPAPWLGTMLLHNALAGAAFYLLLLFAAFLVPGLPVLVLLLAAGKWALFLGASFKSIVSGQERFRQLLYMSLAANVAKVAGACWLITQDSLTLPKVAIVFAIADGLEALTSFLVYRRRQAAPVFRGAFARYRALLCEARPQLGTVIFAAAMSRFDWLYLGAVCRGTQLAEYSFAYKVFELAQLPLLMIAPLLVPRFTRMQQGGQYDPLPKQLLKTGLALAVVSVLLLNGAWVPLADWISGGKYGLVNRGTIALLSLALPVLYYNNYLWSRLFAQQRTALIFRLFALTFFVNVLANWLLVPAWQKEGAAAAFLLALLVQTGAYHFYVVRRPEARAALAREATHLS